MRLEDYWGVGPKTRDLLEAELGTERAIAAIESVDVRALTEAGLSRGRATRILRRVSGGEGMDVLATPDARSVYKQLLDVAASHAVTADAADRIRLITPFTDAADAADRLDAVLTATDSWAELDESTRQFVLETFHEYDEAGGGERPAVSSALALVEADVTEGTFAPLGDVDVETLSAAATALAKLEDGHVRPGADDELDRLRETLESVESLADDGLDVLETIRSGDVRGTEEFREAFIDHVASETSVPFGRVREAIPADATDAADFVTAAFRSLTAVLRTDVEEREAEVVADLEARLAGARDDVDAAVSAVGRIAFLVSLARFARAYDLHRPEFVSEGQALSVENVRNLALVTGGSGEVQPITYAIGDHTLSGDLAPPTGDQVTVLTGANSGGKTTLLETLCQVALLAQMGLPVPADRAEVPVCSSIVFHRRHASFNAGVLESTLRSIVPPLTGTGRTLMLVDEFEAITEPGSAANLLHGLVSLTVEQDALGVFVTHLADDLKPLPTPARIDGIFAEGLNANLELKVDYQPRFDTVGKSTPEFIVSRLVADARDRRERAGFEVLARAVGEEAVQRTLVDARWEEPP